MNPIREEIEHEKVELAIAPLIDVVFLLLIYFMVTSTIQKPEADLGISLPGVIQQSKPVAMPDEQIIEVLDNQDVMLNGARYGKRGDRELKELVGTLNRYRAASLAAGVKALITIDGGDEVPHERVIDVMNACAAAGINNVSFSMGD